MVEKRELQEVVPPMARPYALTHSRLGAITKVIDGKFVCNTRSLVSLYQDVADKASDLHPKYTDFQYLISFTDKTHQENNNLRQLGEAIDHSSKTTDRLVLKWVVVHDLEGVENELSITIRISNPVNPFLYLQAALSESPDDIDNMEFESGTVSVSTNGSGQKSPVVSNSFTIFVGVSPSSIIVNFLHYF